MLKNRSSPTQDTRHDLEVAFPGSSIWTYRVLNGLVTASDAAMWLAKIYGVVVFFALVFFAKLMWAVLGSAFRRRGSRRRW